MASLSTVSTKNTIATENSNVTTFLDIENTTRTDYADYYGEENDYADYYEISSADEVMNASLVSNVTLKNNSVIPNSLNSSRISPSWENSGTARTTTTIHDTRPQIQAITASTIHAELFSSSQSSLTTQQIIITNSNLPNTSDITTNPITSLLTMASTVASTQEKTSRNFIIPQTNVNSDSTTRSVLLSSAPVDLLPFVTTFSPTLASNFSVPTEKLLSVPPPIGTTVATTIITLPQTTVQVLPVSTHSVTAAPLLTSPENITSTSKIQFRSASNTSGMLFSTTTLPSVPPSTITMLSSPTLIAEKAPQPPSISVGTTLSTTSANLVIHKASAVGDGGVMIISGGRNENMLNLNTVELLGKALKPLVK
jgi:hypothetical protein